MNDAGHPAPVLIAYDGSEFADAAVAAAAEELGPGREAIVLTVCEPVKAIPFLGVPGVAVDEEAVAEVFASSREGAERVAARGADLAREAGFDARPLVVEGDPVWRCVADAAEEHGASLIVIGSHGRSGVKLAVLGSVAVAVAQHSSRSVLIVHRDPA